MVRFYQSRDRITPALVRQFNFYSNAFYTYLVAFTSSALTVVSTLARERWRTSRPK